MKKLIKVQAALKAPKGQYNSFGKYSYRSCEDIMEAVKPLLEKENLLLIVSDKVVEVGDYVYVEATATVYDDKEEVFVTAQAGIEKAGGMALPQAFGSASSYARKYALNGLFLIDDTKDADATNEHKKETAPNKEALTESHPRFAGAKKALNDGKTTLEVIKQTFTVSKAVEKKLTGR